MYVHYGCSYLCAPKEWVNFDASFTLRFERLPVVGKLYTKNSQRFPEHVRYGDITRGLPIQDCSADAAYASHVLEHLSLEEFHRALDNTLRILKPGGVFRAVVPDLEHLAKQYLRSLQTDDPFGNDRFLRGSYLGRVKRPKTLKDLFVTFLRTSEHFWMWDRCSLTYALKQHGFVDVRLCAMGDNPDPMFALVEDSSRFEQAVAVEARCPIQTGGHVDNSVYKVHGAGLPMEVEITSSRIPIAAGS